MTVLVTGAAGFIGFHVARRLLADGEPVIGLDNLNAYYDPALKAARLRQLARHPRFLFHRADIADTDPVQKIIAGAGEGLRIVHLAGQAGVRQSLIDPLSYVRSNVEGQVVLLDACRRQRQPPYIVYASSSSVYGSNRKLPFATADPTDSPVSLYGATKKAMEVVSESYAASFGLRLTGLRFFTVYGPWGRPDMAAWIFTRRILADEPIAVFNHGEMYRDFTFIADIVGGVVAALALPPAGEGGRLHRLYNLGNHRPERLLDFIATIEQALGRRAVIDLQPLQPGDVVATCADIETSRQDLGFAPRTTIAEGIPRFVDWYRRYHQV
jgi:UDP-glucuronate 4-epimerase